jgi:hypothetical protein
MLALLILSLLALLLSMMLPLLLVRSARRVLNPSQGLSIEIKIGISAADCKHHSGKQELLAITGALEERV